MCSPLRLIMLSLVMALSLFARESDVKFSLSGARSNYFAGEEAHFNLTGAPALTGRAVWRLTSGSRTVARGEKEVDANQSGATQFSLSCQLPSVSDGVIMPVDLTVSVMPQGNGEAIEVSQRIWLFPRDVAFGQHSLLAKMDIYLFDPEKSFLSHFEKAEIPFNSIYALDALNALTNGTIVVASGLSFLDYRALPEILIAATQRGLDVLLLAPQDGEMRVPLGDDAEEIRPNRLLFEGRGIIKGLDKRLDDSCFEGKRFVLTGVNNIAVIPRGKEEQCWQWVELDYTPSGGKFLMCGFDILKEWDNSPASRYLLIKILEYFGKS